MCFPVDFTKTTFFTLAAYAQTLYISSMKMPSRLRFLACDSCLDPQMLTRKFCVRRSHFSLLATFSLHLLVTLG